MFLVNLLVLFCAQNPPKLSDITERPGQVIGQVVKNPNGTYTSTTKVYGGKPVSSTAPTQSGAAVSSIKKASKK